MTPQEESEFKLYGCVSRCIIRASELAGIPISRDDFATKFSSLFPTGQFGLLSVDDFCIVVKDLGLAGSVSAVRRLEAVKPLLSSPQPWRAFVLTDCLSDGSPLYHCRLALGIGKRKDEVEDSAVHLFSPMQDGMDHELWTPIQHLESEFYHFLIAAP
jgi:hypothetical protein